MVLSGPHWKLAGWFVAWYCFSFITDTLNKKIQSTIRIPATLTFCQFLIGGIATSFLLRVAKVSQFTPLRRDQMGPLFQVGLCWTLGFLTTNYSFGMAAKGSVSFTHAVKATEPVFLVAIASLFFGRSFSLGVWLSLLPIVGGIAIVAVSDLSFTTTSLLMTMIANCCFVARSLFVKKIFSSGLADSFNVFYYISWISAFFTFFIAAGAESTTIVNNLSVFNFDFLLIMLLNGFGHFAYNFASMSLLKLIAPLAHSIGNASRRLVLISGTMIYMGLPFLPKHLLGIGLLMVGVFAYTYISQREAAAAKVDDRNRSPPPSSAHRQSKSRHHSRSLSDS